MAEYLPLGAGQLSVSVRRHTNSKIEGPVLDLPNIPSLLIRCHSNLIIGRKYDMS